MSYKLNRYYLLDRVRIERLHSECKILGLEQRRQKQLLCLMYLYGKVEANVKEPVQLTRAMTKVTFKTATRCTGKYLKSPFYKGKILWEDIDGNLQRVSNMQQFKFGLKTMYKVYREVW